VQFPRKSRNPPARFSESIHGTRLNAYFRARVGSVGRQITLRVSDNEGGRGSWMNRPSDLLEA
jgi:hypothetical protein